MQDKILTRMGDGERLWIAAAELKERIYAEAVPCL